MFKYNPKEKKRYSSFNMEYKHQFDMGEMGYEKALMNVKHRIYELNSLSGGDHKAVLNDILKELDISLKREVK